MDIARADEPSNDNILNTHVNKWMLLSPTWTLKKNKWSFFLQDLFLSVMQLWQIHVAEQMILDDLEANPEKYKGKKLSELTDDDDYDEENNVQYTKVRFKKGLLPKMIVVSFSLIEFRYGPNFCLYLPANMVIFLDRKLVLKNSIWKLP